MQDVHSAPGQPVQNTPKDAAVATEYLATRLWLFPAGKIDLGWGVRWHLVESAPS